MSTGYLVGMIAAAAVTTFLLRAFPFLLFGTGRRVPPIVDYVGKVLSPGAIAMLVGYCFFSYYKEQSFVAGLFGLPELAASAVVVAVQLWKRNPLLSILAGTALYMILVQNFCT